MEIRKNFKYWIFACWSGIIIYLFFPDISQVSLEPVFSISSFLIFLMAVIGLGNIVLQLLNIRTVTFLENFIVRVGIGLGFFQIIFIFIGLMNLYNTPTVWIFIIGTVIITRKNIYRWLQNIVNLYHRNFKKKLTGIDSVILILIIGFLVLKFLNSLYPPVEEYSLAVSLGTAKRYVLNGGITSFNYNYVSGLSPGMSVLYTIGLLLYGPGSARLITFLFLLLVILGVYSLISQKFQKKIAVLGVVLLITSPAIFEFYMVDHYFMGTLFFSFMAFYCYLSWRSRELDIQFAQNGWLILAGLFTAFALAGGLYVMIVPMVFMILVFYTVYTEEKEQKLQKISHFISYYIIPIIIILIPVGLKNHVSTGNLLFPLFSQEIGIDVSFLRSEGEYSLWGYILPLWHLPFKEILNLTNTYYIGVPFIVFIPGVLILKKIGHSIKIFFLYIGLYIFIFIFAGGKLMYIYPLIPVLSIITAYIIVNMYNRGKYLYAYVVGVFFIALGCNFYFMKPKTRLLSTLGQSYNLKEYTLSNVSGYGSMEYLNTETPLDSRVLLIGENRTFYIDRKVIPDSKYSRSPFINIIRAGNNPVVALRENNIDYIMYNQEGLEKLRRYHRDMWDERVDNIFRLLKENFLKLKYNKEGFYIYEL